MMSRNGKDPLEAGTEMFIRASCLGFVKHFRRRRPEAPRDFFDEITLSDYRVSKSNLFPFLRDISRISSQMEIFNNWSTNFAKVQNDWSKIRVTA